MMNWHVVTFETDPTLATNNFEAIEFMDKVSRLCHSVKDQNGIAVYEKWRGENGKMFQDFFFSPLAAKLCKNLLPQNAKECEAPTREKLHLKVGQDSDDWFAK